MVPAARIWQSTPLDNSRCNSAACHSPPADRRVGVHQTVDVVDQDVESAQAPVQISGDRVWSTQTDHYALVAHLDALGHGPKADSAATVILEFIQRHCQTWPTEPTADHLVALLDACHIAAIGTVGASIALVLIDRHQSVLYHVGVGNISLLQFSPTGYEGISRPGSIGQYYRRPKIDSFEIKNRPVYYTIRWHELPSCAPSSKYLWPANR